MSTIDTSTWNPDPALNESIGDIPLNESASIQQTWQAIQMLMAAGGLHGLQLVTFDGATASADGKQGLVPAPEAGDQDKVLKGDGTWGTIDADDVSIAWEDIEDKPSTFPPSSHTHGNLTNDGKIGSTANLPLITTTSGKVTTGSFGTTANTFCQGNDSRLSDSRTPKSHTHGNITNAGAIGSTSGLPVVTGANGVLQAGSFGSTAGTFCEGSDSRLSDARMPTSHTHGSITNDGKLGTASRAVVTDANGAVAVSSVTSTELGYLSGVTSAVQTQINAKAADSGVVHNSGDETIAGGKTFSSCILTTSNATLRHTSASGFVQIGFSPIGNGPRMNLFGKSYSGASGVVQFIAYDGSSSKTLSAGPDGTLTWDGNAIQTASDERLKTHLSAVPDAVLDAWEDVRWGQFQFLDAVSAKGESARLHLGLIAQRVKAVFEARGLDACEYGILCHDVRPAKPAVFDEHGEMLFPAEDAVDLWTVRYTEALAMEAACQRRRADRLEKRLADLEARLAAMEVADA